MSTISVRGGRGIVPPVCTPLDAGLAIDVPSLERLVDFLVEAGVDGLFVLGSTGEVAYLSNDQRRIILETVTGRVSGQVPVLAGVIDTTTIRVVEHVKVAEKFGVDAVVVTAPFYTRTHPAEIELHFRLVAAQTDLPVLAYDIPVSVHSRLDREMLEVLAVERVLAGIKDSSGDLDGVRRLLQARRRWNARDAFCVLTGSELTVDAALQMGADGAIPGLGNVDPHGYCRLYERHRAGDLAGARTEQERLAGLFEIVDIGSPLRMGRGSAALGAFKAALHMRGVIDCPVTAPPQIPLTDGELSKIRALLEAAGILG